MSILCNRCVLRPGDSVDQQYTVKNMLGEGTYGCVYHVADSIGDDYALKILKLWEIPDSERENLLRRFDMEFDTMQIKSNYLVHSFAKGTIEGNPYIVMEFCPHGDLMTAAEKGMANFAKAGKEVLYGLRDMHRVGKVHRDLKPENVLLRADGTAILTDFGISGDQNKRLTERGILGIPKQRFGTFAYMPPEQINPRRGNATVLPTTDIFSFGVMMFLLVTGELPFGPLESDADLPCYTRRGKDGQWNLDLLQGKSSGMEWMPVIEGCLRPDYRQRLQSVDDVLALMPHDDGETYRPPVESPSDASRGQIRNGWMLRVMQGEGHGREYRLNDLAKHHLRILTMGREERNNIVVRETTSAYISRFHCTLELDSGRNLWVIRDGQWRPDCPLADRGMDCRVCTANCPPLKQRSYHPSTNGTYLNSSEVSRSGMPLSLGDIITIGDTKLRVEGY